MNKSIMKLKSEEIGLSIETDTEYVEELIRSSMFIESDLISTINTLSELGLNSKGHGLELTFKES